MVVYQPTGSVTDWHLSMVEVSLPSAIVVSQIFHKPNTYIYIGANLLTPSEPSTAAGRVTPVVIV